MRSGRGGTGATYNIIELLGYDIVFGGVSLFLILRMYFFNVLLLWCVRLLRMGFNFFDATRSRYARWR